MSVNLLKSQLVVLFLTATVLFGCQSDNQPKEEKQHFDKSDAFNSLTDGFSDTFYRVPSPEDLFDLVSAGNVAYSEEVLNPASNLEKYIDTKSKEFNFGVYSADLAYTSAFQRYQESYDYIETVRKLSDEIGISSVFDEATLARVHNIFENDIRKLSPKVFISVCFVSSTITFRSAAHFLRDKAIGIILSGANRDGATGLKAMQEAGGMTIVQDPNDAQVSAMPQAALSLITPDFIFTKDEIIDYLVRQEYGQEGT